MIELKLDKSIWNETERRVDALPIFKNSHRKRAANVVGCMGEIIFEMWMKSEGIEIKPEMDQTTHDYRLLNGEVLDVKAKDRTVKPRPSYDCSIPLYNHAHQRPDYYIFVSLHRNSRGSKEATSRFHTAYILGGLNQAQLDKHGKVWKAGEIDPANGTKFWTDCKNVHINQLTECDVIADKWGHLSETML